MEKDDWIIIIFFLLFVFMSGLWSMDIGITTMSTDGHSNGETITTNGFWTREPIQQYHIGLGLTIISTMSLSFIAIHSIMNGTTNTEKTREKQEMTKTTQNSSQPPRDTAEEGRQKYPNQGGRREAEKRECKGG